MVFSQLWKSLKGLMKAAKNNYRLVEYSSISLKKNLLGGYKMEILGKYGKEEVAILYVAEIDGKVIEFVESALSEIPKKWVLIISSLYGCPVKCQICDAGDYYHGKLSKNDFMHQIDYIVSRRFPNNNIPINKFKIQFARMGEPALNDAVLEVLKELPKKYNAPGLMPCLSTIAPKSANHFFDELLAIKDNYYSNGQFQLQFSVHSTDEDTRYEWITRNIWSLTEINAYGEKWFKEGDRKVTLNFAVSTRSIVDPTILSETFNPSKFFVKLTPVNPTNKALANNIQSGISEENEEYIPLAQEIQQLGFETLISIGDWEENQIGSNCGQLATKYQNNEVILRNNYTTSSYSLN